MDLYQSVNIKNFRTFPETGDINFQAINFISGLNGVGKTTLLETLFFISDRNNPASISRAFQWRKAVKFPLQHILCDEAAGDALIRAKTRLAVESINVHYDRSLQPGNIQISQIPSEIANQGNLNSGNFMDRGGVYIEVTGTSRSDGTPIREEYLLFEGSSGGYAHAKTPGRFSFPRVVIINPSIRGFPTEDASRLSSVILNGKKKDFLDAVNIIGSSIEDVQLLIDNGQPYIAVQTKGSRRYLSSAVLGDGAISVISAVLAVFDAENGAVFFDEIDASIHYTKISKFWELIARTAKVCNCQIFSTSHSRELLKLSAEGVRDADRGGSYQYIRLQRGENRVESEVYDLDSITKSIEFGIEVR